jgi:hypothetical protein
VSLVLKADIRPGRTGELQGKLDRLEAAIAAGGGQTTQGARDVPDGTADGVPDGATDEGYASPS